MNRNWFGKNPDELLRRIRVSSPAASEKEIFDQFCDGLKDDESFLGAIVSHWFANHYRQCAVSVSTNGSVVFSRNGRQQVSLIESRNERDKTRAAVTRLKESMRAVLMDFVLSNGKKLRESTFGDCAHDGGWLLTVAKQGRANEIVGRKLTENDLQNLQRRAMAKKAA